MANIDLGRLEIGFYKLLNDSDYEFDVPIKVQIYLCGMIERAFNQDYAIDLNNYIVPNMKELESRVTELEYDATDSMKLGISLIKIYKIGKYSGEFHTMNPLLQNQILNDITLPQTCFRYAKQFADRLNKKEESEIFGAFINEFTDYTKVLHKFTNLINSGQLRLTKDDYEQFKTSLIAEYNEKEKDSAIKIPDIQEEQINEFIL